MILKNERDMKQFGEKIGAAVQGGDCIELVGDVGAGKTTLVHGLAKGMGIDETIQSPSFTISRTYESDEGKFLTHYDFYRLDDPGIMKSELADTLANGDTVVVIEWAAVIESVLPADRLTITIEPDNADNRVVTVTTGGSHSEHLRSRIS